MESQQNRDIHGRLSKIVNTVRDISEAVIPNNAVGAQTEIVEDANRIDSLVSTLESSASELHDLIVERRDKDTSKDSGNTSFTEVRSVSIDVQLDKMQTRGKLQIKYERHLTLFLN